ncbi:MAG: N-acetylmuramidase domain-containing protein [Candidatus Caenarcaniphilales bacterium]|nr:N-acetylmuramidase domain-containing protein [Candidatus Caenarcaniphilales bacterium]
MNKFLTQAEKDFLITEQAQENNIERAILRAIIDVESSGNGFYKKGESFEGKCKVRFEPDYFEKFSGARPFFIPGSISTKEAKSYSEYTDRNAYEQALIQSPSSTILASSFGLGQIMGFNYQGVGFNSLYEFSRAMESSEYDQLLAMIKFITSNQELAKAAKNKDFAKVASLYNGKTYKEVSYDKKLESAYNALSRNLLVKS